MKVFGAEVNVELLFDLAVAFVFAGIAIMAMR